MTLCLRPGRPGQLAGLSKRGHGILEPAPSGLILDIAGPTGEGDSWALRGWPVNLSELRIPGRVTTCWRTQ